MLLRFLPLFMLLFLLGSCIYEQSQYPRSCSVPAVNSQLFELKEKSYSVKENGFYHTVAKGETLWRIAEKYNVSPKDVAEYNRLPDQEYIEEGQMLYVQPKS